MRTVVLRIVLATVLLAFALPAQAQSDWVALDDAVAAADGKPVLVYVSAAWCGVCRRMEREVFPAVAPLLDRFARARLDFDDHDAALTVGGVTRSPFGWARALGVDVVPGYALLASNGTPITAATGFLDADAFALLLAYAATGAWRTADFETYAARTRGGGSSLP